MRVGKTLCGLGIRCSHRMAGQPELAVVYYQKALELDPTNANAVKVLRELAGGE